MTKEEKQLLLIDLCARLPYGVIIDNPDPAGGVWDTVINIDVSAKTVTLLYNGRVLSIDDIKPYLRPLSSVTEEENKEVKEYLSSIEGQLIGFSQRVIWVNDYCLSHHIDTRHFIEKGLALEAPEGMYK